MTAPTRFSPPPGVIYDETAGVCRAETAFEPAPVCQAPAVSGDAPVDRYAQVSRSHLIADALRDSRPVSRNWGSPLAYSFWSVLSGPVACSSPEDPVQPGDPIRSATPQGAATVMNPQPLRGNLNEYDLSGGASTTATVWSVFNSTTPAETGTFAYVRNGSADGVLVTASNDASSLHKFTTSATLEDGSSIVAYTKTTGEEEPSSIVAHRVSASGTVEGSEITILAPAIRTGIPDAQLVATSDGFVAVYREGGNLMAAAFNNSGAAQGSPQNLGPAPTRFAVNRDEDGHWVLAEIVSDNQIRLRTFNGVSPGGVDETVTTSGFSATPNLSVAIQEGGTMMVAWNKPCESGCGGDPNRGGGIMGAVFNGSGGSSGAPFEIRSTGNANTMSLASDHRGNFVFAWEEAGAILARVYNGTSAFTTPADFASISTSGTANSNVQAHVSDSGRLVLTWVRSSTSGGETLQDMVRREYQLNY